MDTTAGPPAADARTVALAAAEQAGVVVRDLAGQQDMRAATAVLDTAWGRAPEAGHVMPHEALIAMADAGCQVSGAWRRDTLVGATAAFLGRDDGGRLLLHSHVTGVLADAHGSGVGWALKQHQRAWALDRGIDLVRWTFDPLVRRNAVFNLVKLGARPVAYRQDVYGPMADTVNAGLPTDRFETEWQLTERRVEAAARGRHTAPDVAAVRRTGAVEVLDVGADDAPIVDTADAPRLLAHIPADIETMRAGEPALAASWAGAVRETIGAAMRAGHHVTGITRDGWYVLARRADTEELA